MNRWTIFVGCGTILLVGSGFAYTQWKQDRVNAEQTAASLDSMKSLVEMHSIVHGRLPGPSFEEVIESLNDRKDWVAVSSFGPLANGRDWWDEPVIYRLVDEDRAILRSKGPNKTDENGTGDDIEVVIHRKNSF